MKKVSLLVLLAIVASTLLMAAIPTSIVRLTVINKSDFDVYIKLEGSAVTQAFYYLTIPSGTKDTPTIKVFTIMVDVYKRTTWQCNGVQSTGNLFMSGNLRLTFTPCGTPQCDVPWDFGVDHFYLNKCGKLVGPYTNLKRFAAGEPTMEKVTYFKYLYKGTPAWNAAYLYNGFWNFGCGTWYYRIRTYYTPYGCAYRYQY